MIENLVLWTGSWLPIDQR